MKKLVDLQVPKVKGGLSNVENQTEKKPDLVTRIKEAREDALVEKAVTQVFGLDNKAEAAEKPESLASQIVTKSMETQTTLIKQMGEDTKELKKEVDAANKSASEMQYALLSQQLTQIQTAQAKADESAKAALGAGAPKDAFGFYAQVKGELEKLTSKVTTPAAVTQTGMSDETQMRRKELELEQQRVLAQITSDNTKAQQEFSLKLAEFQDNKEIRRMEYADKKSFRTEGLQGVTDLVAAIGAGITQQGGPTEEDTEVAMEHPTKVGASKDKGAYINSFKCSLCGGEVPVNDGQEMATCPNPECNASFTIKDK